MAQTINVDTSGRTQMLDITTKVSDIVSRSQIAHGFCLVFVPHTTAGVTINENADPDVVKDIGRELDKVVPLGRCYMVHKHVHIHAVHRRAFEYRRLKYEQIRVGVPFHRCFRRKLPDNTPYLPCRHRLFPCFRSLSL